MEKLEFKTVIAAGKKKVWDTMLKLETYQKWTSVSWPGSSFEGSWKQGEDMFFGSPGQGGTMATIVESRPYEYLLAKHIAIVNPDGSLDKESEMAKGWVGATESYTFTEKNGETTLSIEIQVTPEWVKMFEEGWPKALVALKEICEEQAVNAV